MQQNRSKPKTQRSSWRNRVLRGSCLVLSVLTVRVVALQAYTITSGSMEPTLLVGDFVQPGLVQTFPVHPGDSMEPDRHATQVS